MLPWKQSGRPQAAGMWYFNFLTDEHSDAAPGNKEQRRNEDAITSSTFLGRSSRSLIIDMLDLLHQTVYSPLVLLKTGELDKGDSEYLHCLQFVDKIHKNRKQERCYI